MRHTSKTEQGLQPGKKAEAGAAEKTRRSPEAQSRRVRLPVLHQASQGPRPLQDPQSTLRREQPPSNAKDFLNFPSEPQSGLEGWIADRWCFEGCGVLPSLSRLGLRCFLTGFDLGPAGSLSGRNLLASSSRQAPTLSTRWSSRASPSFGQSLDGSVELVYFSLSYLSLGFQLTEYPS